jgi:phenylacetate-coenzyme A ligase PaaK-like adenylate-forming protein
MLLEVLRDWAWLQRTQWMNAGELEQIQTEKLRETVIHAYQKVPFYNRLYQALDLPINSSMRLKDLSQFPTTTRIDLQATPLRERTAVDAEVDSCTVIKSSGTTGKPISTLEDLYSATYREALMLRFLWAYGVRPLDRIVRGRYWKTPVGDQTTTHVAETKGLWGFLRRRIVRQRYFTNFSDQYQFLSRSKPDVLIAGVYYCRALAEHCERAGKSLRFRIILTSGDIIDSATKKLIEDSFRAEVFDNYGIEEVGGSVAWECPEHFGYHINSESLLLEFLRNEESVGPGESGEVYVTCFHRKATPIIRYFTGDHARYVNDECPCGRGLSLIREIEGRSMDFIVTSNGGHVSPHVVLKVLTEIDGVKQFKVTQSKGLSIEIRIMTDAREPDRIIRNVQQHCKELFNDTFVDVKHVDKIDTDSKFRIVESQATN